METLTVPAAKTPGKLSAAASSYDPIRDYYNIAGPDYETWSRDFNMHFGYCKDLTDIFSLEKMLYRMNDEVLNRLQLPVGKPVHIADLGCGVGTVARYTAKKYAHARITATTIVDYQVEKGKELITKEGLENKVHIIKDNFENSCFADGHFDFVYALESACHAGGSNKELFISEMARMLKTGGRFCIADGFLKHDRQLPWLFRKIYDKIINCWALPCFGNLDEFRNTLQKHGLKDIKTEEISLCIAPSVAYVPWTCLKFFVTEIWRNKKLRLKKREVEQCESAITWNDPGIVPETFWLLYHQRRQMTTEQ